MLNRAVTHATGLPDLSSLEGVERVGSGKVRELYAVGEDLLLVASDRISAFDVVLPTPVPDKGAVLTGLTSFWLDHFAAGIVADHRITTDVDAFPSVLAPHADALRGRSMLCRRAEVIPLECVARGYLAGSGWAEYQRAGTVCGVRLPDGMAESAELDEPLFTPATKAASGHDENISFQRAADLVGSDVAERLRDVTLRLYGTARAHARSRGIILADTKFEFGFIDSELTLIDEVLTPDSSRFWPADEYRPGRSQASYDKQYVRDWLLRQDWDKTPPGPQLPDEVVIRTRERYVTAYQRLTGLAFADWS
ncbi:MAG: phosphoribosylaminoimidazolesuccinocarboxamide synthase [Actinomycetota bacterium]|jgi:phosphoribosylaminoimidazole-succinocarboxamide synthase|nr:phosphoribosylaminoimidazolesuccinocarboxamide synthase [Actinomycetota bacterium]